MRNLFAGIFGSRNQRLLKSYSKNVKQINALEETVSALSPEDMKARTAELKAEVEAGKTLDAVLPEAFALAREAAKRALGMRHFDVQLIGGMALHEGKISEMRTGEGKTLVATLPAYLNALSGKGVHIVTVNEYLAQRDAEWMGPVYETLGLTVGVIRSNQDPAEKHAAYGADITYGTNNEFGFDYLRDNLAFSLEQRSQRGLNFAIVDEVDSILIDEARTPLIISGPAEDSTETYLRVNQLVPQLEPQVEKEGPGDFSVDEKAKQAFLTEEGHAKVEALMASAGLIQPGESLYDARNIMLMQHLAAALRAHFIYRRDVEYIVKDGEVIIVDEFTGRTMPGRRWSDGLHQAIEAKEGVKVRQENQTLASITFQNFFRMYETLSGMTGTADTEAFEFQQIYGLEVVVIPTHRPMIRADHADLVYLTKKDKFDAILDDIRDCRERGQPVLVGTTSIETSELLSSVMTKEKIGHEVLNAKQHAREAEIVAQAGRPGAVTIATNMAGRGTDIVLGGSIVADLDAAGDDPEKQAKVKEEWQARHQQVIDAGGLHIIGTERHESRRIDNQLRGRSGRQGDPGSSRFYLSMEDNLMRIFGEPEKTKALLSRVGMKEGEVIESRMLSRQIERAQRKVEAHNFDIRKQLLKYDDVANDQRRVIYGQRTELMEAEEIGDSIAGIREEVVNDLVERFVPANSVEEQWDIEGLEKQLDIDFGFTLDLAAWIKEDPDADPERIAARVLEEADRRYEEKVEKIGDKVMRQFEKAVMLQQLDVQWKEHLAAMDYLRQGIHLRGYAQKNPEQEYKREAFQMFSDMLDRVKRDVISIVSRVQIRSQEEVDAIERQRREAAAMKLQLQHGEAQSATGGPGPGSAPGAGPGPVAQRARPPAAGAEAAEPFVRPERKVGRNEPCPCGSGKKYKHCHGQLN
ncbi:preprotein translocase subunit SecA [Wenzhouxiangella sp. XN24]|uniref:preprotein translocase subunit SecA n=1 Tax=Wenzhouxiangella sp. XN24 TaxID=2713569 RepID=UPI0013EC9456|nr:preprotein translocase subunit SecA [Wenzhouxiangella sp. XN24]